MARVGRHPAARDDAVLRVLERHDDPARRRRRRRARAAPAAGVVEGGDEDVEVGGRAVEAARDEDVVEVALARRRVQQDVAVQPRVVEKVHLQPLHRPARGVDLRHARRDGRRREGVVEGDRDAVGAAKVEEARVELNVEGQVPALVLADQLAVEEDGRVVIRRADVEDHALALPREGHEDVVALVPDEADVLALPHLLHQVVVRGRHRHRHRARHACLVPLLLVARSAKVHAETPDAIEV